MWLRVHLSELVGLFGQAGVPVVGAGLWNCGFAKERGMPSRGCCFPVAVHGSVVPSWQPGSRLDVSLPSSLVC